MPRRYNKGLNNFFTLYQPLADSWQVYDNSNLNQLALIATGSNQKTNLHIVNEKIWCKLLETNHE